MQLQLLIVPLFKLFQPHQGNQKLFGSNKCACKATHDKKNKINQSTIPALKMENLVVMTDLGTIMIHLFLWPP